MKTIQQGDIIKVHYTGTLDDGTVFDQTDEKNPAYIQVGAETILPHINQTFLGMKVGEEKTITLSAEDAFGPWDKEKVHKLSGVVLGEDRPPEIGQVLKLHLEGEEKEVYGKVIDAGPLFVEVDLNHPLAGKTLHYTIRVVEIERE